MRNTACVVCGKELKPAFEDDIDNESPPSAATVFTSHGNFGSTLWDPVGSSRYLQVTLCDKCLSQAAAAGRVLLCEPQRAITPVKYSIWSGEFD
jgi:hypothetical protein